ncbi:MAG: 50S ribosomal protein L21 [Patescibacteria group bacterium]|jgi:large subunit ribosomal protein L21
MSTQNESKDFAVIATGGKQYVVHPGQTIAVEKLEEAEGQVTFEKVLLQSKAGKVTIGTPEISGAKVMGTILKTAKGKKIMVVKYKNKTRQRSSNGHRQTRATVKIESV